MNIKHLAIVFCVVVLVWIPSAMAGEDAVVLRPAPTSGRQLTYRVQVAADGKIIPAIPGATPVPISVQGRFRYLEQVVEADEVDGVTRALRRYDEAEATITVGAERTVRQLRPEARELWGRFVAGSLVLSGRTGPLLLSEIELVEIQADPLALPALLPLAPVRKGEEWQPGSTALAAVIGLDAYAGGDVNCKFESLEGNRATISLRGDVEGAVQGGSSRVHVEGKFVVDTAEGVIVHSEWDLRESRQANDTSPALEMRGRLTLDASSGAGAPLLAADAPREPNASGLLVLHADPRFRYALAMDRQWQALALEAKGAAFRRLVTGEAVAQCHVDQAAPVAAGTRLDPATYRAEVEKSLGARLQEVLQAGSVSAAPGYQTVRVAALGNDGGVALVWYYYMVQAASGERFSIVFTVDARHADSFGTQDASVVQSLRITPPRAASRR